MTTQEVANRLVELCREGKYSEAQEELYAENVTSTEPAHSPFPPAQGREAVIEKGKQFSSMIVEHHGSSMSDPIVSGNHFSVASMLDATMSDRGRMKLEEINVYEVKDGKVVSETFHY